jgi:hypothetical protein
VRRRFLANTIQLWPVSRLSLCFHRAKGPFHTCLGQRPRKGSDPNRPDDPEYIVRLVGQVVWVSVETVRIVKGLPPIA